MTTNTNAALRSAAESALEALEILNGIDTETESVTIHVSDEIAALRAALTTAAPQPCDIIADAVRVPLDSLHADAEWLCARLLDKSLTREEVVTAIRSRIDAAKAALTTAAAVPPEGVVMVPKVPDERMERAIAAAFFGTVHEARKAWVAGIAAAPKAEPVPAAGAHIQQESAYTSVQLAEMVLSDCGHSSNYQPLLERVAGRIDRHVERLLTVQQADRALRAQAAPTSSASVEITDEQMHQGLAAAFAHPRAAAPDAVFKAGVDFGVSVALLQTAPTTQATPQPAVQQGDELPREDFAWLVVQEACETEPADEDDPECIRILRRDLKSAVLSAFLRHDAAHPAAPVAQGDARAGKFMTVVYRDISPGEEARALCEHPKASAMSWSHALNERDAARAAVQAEELPERSKPRRFLSWACPVCCASVETTP